MDCSEQVKLIRTDGGGLYAYDALTSMIFTVAPSLRHDAPAVAEAVRGRSGARAALLSGIEWPLSFERYMEKARHGIPSLLLQTTRRCNLDCDYCVYSGNYAHMRAHEDLDMTPKIARESVDFYAAHSAACGKAALDFYGGEALLRFGLVRETTEYARARLAGKPIRFSVTTNGTLLTARVARWLDDNPDVNALVTLNGPTHDAHSKTAAGQGSLSAIMGNLRALRASRPRVWAEQIHFIANIAHPGELGALRRFYMDEVGKPPDVITHIRDQDGNERIRALLDTPGARDEDMAALYGRQSDAFLDAYFRHALRGIHTRRIFSGGGGGVIASCLPFLEKLYVLADGQFALCETACDKAVVGSLQNGMDTEALRALYDGLLALQQKKCRACWAQRLCTVCFKDVLRPDGRMADDIPESFCTQSRAFALDRLRVYCAIAEHDRERLRRL